MCHNSSPADVRDETRVVVDKDGGASRTRRRGDSNPRTRTRVTPTGSSGMQRLASVHSVYSVYTVARHEALATLPHRHTHARTTLGVLPKLGGQASGRSRSASTSHHATSIGVSE